VQVTFYSSAFCGACSQTRSVLDEVGRLVPAAHVTEYDIVGNEDRAEADDIRSTPTLIVARDDGSVVFRAEGVPTAPQVLQALALAL
jgi:thiol-disulfide isomerase/thioredoxin